MIKINDSACWDETAGAQQSEQAMEWLCQEIYPRLSAEAAEKDQYGRPRKWEISSGGVIVTVERKYTKPASWAKDRDIVTVKEIER